MREFYIPRLFEQELKIEPLPHEEQFALCCRLREIEIQLSETPNNFLLQQEWERIAQQLQMTNFRLIYKIAKKFAHSEEHRAELVQIGCMAAARAVRGFKLDRGTRFSTYLGRSVYRAVKEYMRDEHYYERKGMTVPEWVYEAIEVLYSHTDTPAALSTEEILTILNDPENINKRPNKQTITPEIALDIRDYLMSYTVELDDTPQYNNFEDGTVENHEIVGDPNSQVIEDEILGRMHVDWFENFARECLTEEEFAIFSKNFGLFGGKRHSSKELSREYGYLVTKINKIVKTAMRKLRNRGQLFKDRGELY